MKWDASVPKLVALAILAGGVVAWGTAGRLELLVLVPVVLLAAQLLRRQGDP